MRGLTRRIKLAMMTTKAGTRIKKWIANWILRRRWLEKRRFRTSRLTLERGERGNRLLIEMIESSKPFAAAKIGEVEMQALEKYRKAKNRGMPCRWNGEAERLWSVPGVYPPTSETYNRFCEMFPRAVASLDLFGVWNNLGELALFRSACPRAQLAEAICLEPYFFDEPWSAALRGKRVLVASCFAKTIQQQYARREEVWQGHQVLPEFELVPFQVPFKANMVKPKFETWFDSLEEMKQRIASTKFDVMLIGAGPYSVPLLAHTKELGRQGIHLGGAIQVLFGIKGGRWKYSLVADFWNDAWIPPLPEESPEASAFLRSNYWIE